MFRSLWVFWDFNKEAVVGLSLGLALIGLLVLLFGAFGRVERVEGRIVDFIIAGRRGIEPVALVAVDGRSVQIREREGGGCQVGSEITLTRQRRLIGWRYQTAPVPNPCRGAE